MLNIGTNSDRERKKEKNVLLFAVGNMRLELNRKIRVGSLES